LENDKKKDYVKVKVQLFENGELIDEKEGTGLVGALVVKCDCGCGEEALYSLLRGRLSEQDLIVAAYRISQYIDGIILGDLPSLEEVMKGINLQTTQWGEEA
jgi:hypothetical protein